MKSNNLKRCNFYNNSPFFWKWLGGGILYRGSWIRRGRFTRLQMARVAEMIDRKIRMEQATSWWFVSWCSISLFDCIQRRWRVFRSLGSVGNKLGNWFDVQWDSGYIRRWGSGVRFRRWWLVRSRYFHYTDILEVDGWPSILDIDQVGFDREVR